MRITVECCGPARLWCGAERVSLDLREPADVADVSAALSERFPAIAANAGALAWASGDRVLARDEGVADGAVLAVIPPVSGG